MNGYNNGGSNIRYGRGMTPPPGSSAPAPGYAPTPTPPPSYAPAPTPAPVYGGGGRGAGYLSTEWGLLKYILLTLVTCGIYSIYTLEVISGEINLAAFRHDGKKTMAFCTMAVLFAPLTFGIAPFVWYHKLSDRIGDQLRRRGIAYTFGASDFWLWNVLGSFIIVGPFIYMHKMFTAVNLINGHYNVNG